MINDKDKPDEVEGMVEFTTREEYVKLSCDAITTILQMKIEMDIQLMSKQDQRRINSILKKSLAIIDINITDMYNEHTEEPCDD